MRNSKIADTHPNSAPQPPDTHPHASKASLARLFESACDPDLLRAIIERHVSGQIHLPVLGRGCHFDCFALRQVGLPLIIKLARHPYLSLQADRQRWVHTVKQFAASGLRFAPPVKILTSADYLAVVMPLLATVPSSMTNFDERAASALASCELAAHGYNLDDAIQWRFWHDTPYIVDLSDLIRVKPRR